MYTCISSIYKKTEGVSFEIIVVDNHSQDESESLIKASFPSVIWINMGYNAGFARANNAGFDRATGKYLLLLNSDTELYENSIFKTWQHYLELEKNFPVGFVGCKIQSNDYSLQPSCNYFYPGIKELLQENPFVILIWVRWLKKNILKKINKYGRLNENHKVVWIGVPFALIKATVKQQKGMLFDTDFFMYSEDKEWNFRLSKKGFLHFYYSGTGVFHYNGGSNSFPEKRLRQIIVSKWLFILKANGWLYTLLYFFLQSTNLLCDGLFFLLAKLKGKAEADGAEAEVMRKKMWKWMFIYAPKILFYYKKKYSSSEVPLNTYSDPQ